jgi:GNAT superfamily N-acetyltransferase
MTAITIVPVNGKTGLADFIRVPHDVFRDDPHWVAPLDIERREHLDPARNPYFRHAEAQLFVAHRAGRPVGRISAQLDRLRLERHRDATGQFGFFDVPDDRAVSAAHIGAAAAWLRARGLQRMQGPFSFSINDETGLLVDGFDTPPCMMMGHARPYMAAHLEAAGFAKVKDVLAYDYDARKPLPRAMQAMADKVKAAPDIALRALDKKHLERDLAIVMDIFNDAWSDNWGFVPFTTEEVNQLGKNLKMLVSDGYIAIAEYRSQPVAMAVTLPDINGWLADLGGRLLPFGWAKLAWRLLLTAPKAVRMPLMGVRKAYHGTALGSALALGVIERIRRYHLDRGTARAELSWILEDNRDMRRIIEGLGAQPYKTYRIYEMTIA